ncbi:lysozyme-like protein, partial [Martensiomyces pterosporus]
MIPAGAIASAREAAMFLANILWESDGLRAKEEYQCKNNPSACVGQYTTPQDVPGQTYWGRGYIQLTWHYNYLAASMALYGDDRLATNAAQVATNEDIAWAVSFWYWKAEVRTDPGVMAGQFGSAVNRINGALECSGPNQDLARKRYQIYKAVLAVFSPGETPIETGCYN